MQVIMLSPVRVTPAEYLAEAYLLDCWESPDQYGKLLGPLDIADQIDKTYGDLLIEANMRPIYRRRLVLNEVKPSQNVFFYSYGVRNSHLNVIAKAVIEFFQKTNLDKGGPLAVVGPDLTVIKWHRK